MTDSRYQEQIRVLMIVKSAVLASRCVRAFGLMLILAALALGGCGETVATPAPDRSTVSGLAQYVLWTFRTDSVEEFEKVYPPLERIEQWAGKANPNWLKVAIMGNRQHRIDDWKAIKKLAAELGIDWQQTEIVDVDFTMLRTGKAGEGSFQESDGAAVMFETNGKRWWFYLDDLMRTDEGIWYICDTLKWREEEIRAAIKAPQDSYIKPSNSSMQRLQAEAAKALNTKVNITLDLGKGLSMKLALIPAGKFLMGSPKKERGGAFESPQREVTISQPFYMGVYEVTQSQWRAVMGSEPWDGKPGTKSGTNNPACYISWDDASKFCDMLSKTTGKKVMLPTEAQWEYACRAGSNTAYCFGDDASKLGDFAWYTSNASGKGKEYAHAVGQKKPNAWGLYDMHGNVWEWCRDWYDKKFYAKAKNVDPENTTESKARIVRGGSWSIDAFFCRAAIRYDSPPRQRSVFFGFRVLVYAGSVD